jgi:hypothetical protein
MSFDQTMITSPNSTVTFTDSGLASDAAAGALKAARELDGDEVVVGYVNDEGELKYALIDARTAGSHSKQVAKFSPDQLGFADGGHVATAFTVKDDQNFDVIASPIKILPL